MAYRILEYKNKVKLNISMERDKSLVIIDFPLSNARTISTTDFQK